MARGHTRTTVRRSPICFLSSNHACSILRCDTEPLALARYVLALVAKDKPLDKLRENCIDRLEVFLDRSKRLDGRTSFTLTCRFFPVLATKDFVDQLFDVIRNGRYIPEAKKVRSSMASRSALKNVLFRLSGECSTQSKRK